MGLVCTVGNESGKCEEMILLDLDNPVWEHVSGLGGLFLSFAPPPSFFLFFLLFRRRFSFDSKPEDWRCWIFTLLRLVLLGSFEYVWFSDTSSRREELVHKIGVPQYVSDGQIPQKKQKKKQKKNV